VVGSVAIAREPVRGFLAVETVGTSWFEYDLERSRVQEALPGKTPEEVDRAVREYTPCSYRFYVEKQKPEELSKEAACAGMFAPFGAVPYTYMQAVADISLGQQWKTADFPVLVVYGTASPVTTAHQGRYLAELINCWHPGRATYAEVPGMGHDLARYASPEEYMKESRSGKHPFHSGLMDMVLPWLERLIS
jgi:pimeloyl-ACP methyl ester carboxylesterase